MKNNKATEEEQQVSEPRRRSHPRRTVRILSYLGVAFLVIGGIFIIPNLISFSPRFCSTCHGDRYQTWQNATHKNVTCTDCHINADTWDALRSRVGIIDKVIIKMGLSRDNPNITGFNDKPTDVSCDTCHKVKRAISPAGDLIIPHDAHTRIQKLACVDCHKKLVHSTASKKGNRPSMLSCYSCHDGKKAPNQCSACHTEKALPEDHKAADWLRIHSQVEAQDPAYCEGCHGWVKDFCAECHKRKPRSHDKTWPQSHQVLITTDRKEGCAKCHGEQRCQSCHTKKKKIEMKRD